MAFTGGVPGQQPNFFMDQNTIQNPPQHQNQHQNYTSSSRRHKTVIDVYHKNQIVPRLDLNKASLGVPQDFGLPARHQLDIRDINIPGGQQQEPDQQCSIVLTLLDHFTLPVEQLQFIKQQNNHQQKIEQAKILRKISNFGLSTTQVMAPKQKTGTALQSQGMEFSIQFDSLCFRQMQKDVLVFMKNSLSESQTDVTVLDSQPVKAENRGLK